MKKRGQAWYIDFMVGLTIFMSVIVSYYAFQESLIDTNGFTHDMLADAKQISNSLMSEGYPTDWNATNVSRIGILTNGRIDSAKLLKFSQMNYNDSRRAFRTSYDYEFVLIEGSTLLTLPNGQKYIGSNSSNSSARFKVSRLPVYNSTLVLLEVYVWKP